MEKSKCKLQDPRKPLDVQFKEATHSHSQSLSHAHAHTHAHSCSGLRDLGSSAGSALDMLCDLAEDLPPFKLWVPPTPRIGELKLVSGRPGHMGNSI